jgi:hypothetical protein
MNKKIQQLLMTILDDEYGVGEKAYNLMLELGLPSKIQNQVDAVDGRFYLPEQ